MFDCSWDFMFALMGIISLISFIISVVCFLAAISIIDKRASLSHIIPAIIIILHTTLIISVVSGIIWIILLLCP